MLKKIILLAVLLSSSSFSFAKNADTTLTIAPDHPANWGYRDAMVIIDNNFTNVGSGTTIPVSLNSNISLIVYAMNVKPKLADSCQNIKIQQEGPHQILFKLENDWLIHCQHS